MIFGAPRDDAHFPIARSYLYVPGDQPRFLNSARSRGADAVIVDLEDGVAPCKKALAREAVEAWLSRQAFEPGEIWIRISSADTEADIELARFPCVRGLVLPKAEVETVRQVDLVLADREGTPGRVSPLQVIPLIETAAGLESVATIASLPRVLRFGIGRADLLADLGVAPHMLPSGELTGIWLRIVIASAASGIQGPIAPVETVMRRDGDSGAMDRQLETTTRYFFALGFRARTAIHPNQVEVINKTFTPTAAEVEAARQKIEQFERAVAAGTGVFVDEYGAVVDEAVIRAAREVLHRSQTL